MSQIIPVRKGEELNTEKLHQFLRVSILDLPKEPLVIKQFGSGASNLTYALSVGEWEAVLRRPPFSQLRQKRMTWKENTRFYLFYRSRSLSLLGRMCFVKMRRWSENPF